MANKEKNTASDVGALFLIAVVTYIQGDVIIDSVSAPDYLIAAPAIEVFEPEAREHRDS